MTERDWKTVVGNVCSGHCVLLLGPDVLVGGPAAATPRTELTAHLSKLIEAENQKPRATTLGGVAQQYSEVQDRPRLEDEVRDFYRDRKVAPSPEQVSLAAMPFPLIITSGHDEDFKHALEGHNKVPDVGWYHFRGTTNTAPAMPPKIDRPALYYLHGSPEAPKSLVLTDGELIESLIALISGRAPFPTSLTGYLRNRETCFLFIGFGLRHWYLRLLLHALTINGENLSMALEPLSEVTATQRDDLILFYRHGHKIVVDDVDPGTFIAELNNRFVAAGGAVAAPSVGGVRAGVFISYASEDLADAERLEAALTLSGFNTWLDKKRLEGGVWWDQVIKDSIDESDYVVVLQSPALLAKIDSYVNEEIKYAMERGRKVQSEYKFLIPFSLSKVAPHPDLRGLQTLAIEDGSFDEKVKALSSIITRDYQLRAKGRRR